MWGHLLRCAWRCTRMLACKPFCHNLNLHSLRTLQTQSGSLGGKGFMVCSAKGCMHAQVAPEDLDGLKDSLEHYLDCAAEPDFVEVGQSLRMQVSRAISEMSCRYWCHF